MRKSYPSYRVERPKLVGGALALDFVNTVEARGAAKRAERADRLTGYDELLIWGEAAGTIDRKARQRLEAAAKRNPDVAAAALAASIGLRDTLEALLAAPAARQAPLEPFNAWLARAPERARLTSTAQGYSWLGGATADDVLAPIWPVVWSAADLLVSGQTARVRSCANRHCAWLFIDASRNQRRRWCSMEDCGNRAKARRHYRRHRAA